MNFRFDVQISEFKLRLKHDEKTVSRKSSAIAGKYFLIDFHTYKMQFMFYKDVSVDSNQTNIYIYC